MKKFFFTLAVVVAAMSASRAQAAIDYSARIDSWCQPHPEGHQYHSPCNPLGNMDCGADGRETICVNGIWQATGQCCPKADRSRDAICWFQRFPRQMEVNRHYFLTVGCQNTGTNSWHQHNQPYALRVWNPGLVETRVQISSPYHVRTGDHTFYSFWVTPRVPGRYSGNVQMIQEVMCDGSINDCNGFGNVIDFTVDVVGVSRR